MPSNALTRNTASRPVVGPCRPASRWQISRGLLGRLALGFLASAAAPDLARSEPPGELPAATQRRADKTPQRQRERFRFAGERTGLWPKSWPRLRGSSAAGVGGSLSVECDLATKPWEWSIALPGSGHASPVVYHGRIFVVSADPATASRTISCHELTDGRLCWQVDRQATRDHHHAQNSLASSSPIVDATAVYWSWASAERLWVEALDHEGRRLWQISPGPYVAEHGFAASPAVWEHVLIVPMDQDGPSSVVGLDRTTGRQLWRLPRQTARTSYATPLVLEGEEPVVILSSMAHGLTAIDPRNGDVVWERSCFPRRTVSSPITVGDLLVATCGEGGGNNLLVALRPGDHENNEPSVAYQLERGVAPYVPTPLATAERLYLWGDRGVVTCVDPASGATRWRGRVGGSYSSSPIAVSDVVINVSADGEVVLIADADRFEVLGRRQLDEPSRATPAVADGRLLLRSEQRLYALDLTQP